MPTWELLCHMMFFQHGVGLGPAHAQSVLYGGGNIRRHIANDYDTILVKNQGKKPDSNSLRRGWFCFLLKVLYVVLRWRLLLPEESHKCF